jgi:hypothetical protein
MKLIFALIVCCSAILQLKSQTGATILSPDEVERVVNPSIKNAYGIYFPIFRVLSYDDALGTNYVILTENRESITADGDTLNTKIKAIHHVVKDGVETSAWGLDDFTASTTPTGGPETSIWFWTRFCQFTDYDNDGFVEPIMVYGSNGQNSTMDGRIKIFVYYQGKKFGIRHQNSPLDGERVTTVDAGFYNLPTEVQTGVINVMKSLVTAEKAIFRYDWEQQLKLKKLKFVD